MSKKVYALVEWVGPDFKNTFTAGVPVEWIRDFNVNEFRGGENVDPDESYIIEWRDEKKKEPQKGWPVYDGVVRAIAHKVKKLERILDSDFGGAISSDFLTPSPEPRSSSPKNFERLRKNLEDDFERIEEDNLMEETQRSPEKTTKRRRKKNAADPQECKRSNENEETNRRMSDFQKLLGNVEKRPLPVLQKTVIPSAPPGIAQINDNESDYSRYTSENMVEIGRPGSNVFITSDQWDTAMETKTFTAMATSLTIAAYPEDVLLISNLGGGKSKINKNGPRYNELDKRILNKIKYTVRKRFLATFNRARFGAAINSKLGKMRKKDSQ